MKKHYFSLIAATLALSSSAMAADTPSIGVVNFASCITDSKLGKQEQASFESIKNQMTAMIENTEKELNELAAKFNDPEYLDGLSPEAEEEMKARFRSLSEEMNRYQNQYYQVLNQANMRVMQTINTSINTAAEKVAKDQKLSAVLNKDACFYFAPKFEVTKSVIAEMDKNFDAEAKVAPVTPPPAA